MVNKAGKGIKTGQAGLVNSQDCTQYERFFFIFVNLLNVGKIYKKCVISCRIFLSLCVYQTKIYSKKSINTAKLTEV